MEWLTELITTMHWGAVAQIIMIDILLGGDNAVVIALACRNLDPHQRRQGIFWGVFGAIALRVVLITCAVYLLQLPLLKVVAGLLLIWIGVKLLIPHDEEDKHIEASTKVLSAIKTIIAGAAQAAHEHHQTLLIIFGLIVSVPFIVFGSQIILKVFDRFPIIITLGGALLGWIGGGLVVSDIFMVEHIPQTNAVHYGACIIGAALVVLLARMWVKRQKAKKAAG